MFYVLMFRSFNKTAALKRLQTMGQIISNHLKHSLCVEQV